MGVRARVVNARHVKHVPGRKTDVGTAQWLATLARAGLSRGSFIPKSRLRELRLMARLRQKLVGQLASEKKRLHQELADGGIRFGVLLSDDHGQSARAMGKGLIAGQSPQAVLRQGESSAQSEPAGLVRCGTGRVDGEPSLRAGGKALTKFGYLSQATLDQSPSSCDA